jgi:ABC-type phosphate transport system permease subunit
MTMMTILGYSIFSGISDKMENSNTTVYHPIGKPVEQSSKKSLSFGEILVLIIVISLYLYFSFWAVTHEKHSR